jgi:hypothetical protein
MGPSERIAIVSAFTIVTLAYCSVLFFLLRRYEKLFHAYFRDKDFPDFTISPAAWRFRDLIFRWEGQTNTMLTNGARQMLLIPIVEEYERSGGVPFEVVNESLRQIFAAMREDPSPVDSRNTNVRSSLSVIRAFWGRFCNIPPFCSRVER